MNISIKEAFIPHRNHQEAMVETFWKVLNNLNLYK